ncbi:MAG: hypothetical protein NW217_00165 [Hyphomicrobiaceae bacterium]|nr:hypothetical protein [Hyphomicrobiaceae bacterium]
MSTERQVETARLVASTPSASAALCSIVALKRELGALEPPAAERPVPPLGPVRRSPARRIVAGLGAVAAALLLVLALGLGHQTPAVAPTDFVTAALTAGPRSATDRAVVPPVAAALEEHLAVIGLVPLWRIQDAPGFLHIGFGGARGCRLSVHLASANEQLDIGRLAGQQASAWLSPRHAVIVRATAMPAERFEVAVSLVRALLGDEVPAIADAAARARLAAAWRDGRPCLA